MTCKQIGKSDKVAGAICTWLVTAGAKEKDLKSSQNVYDKAIDRAMAEAQKNYKRLTQRPKNPRFALKSPWLKFLKKQDVIIPFIFDDLSANSASDIGVLRKLAAKKGKVRNLTELHNFVTSQAGLGMLFSTTSANKTPHALDAVATKKGNCLEFIYLYYGISRLLGLTIRVLDEVDLKGTAHVFVGSGNKFLDPQDGGPPTIMPKNTKLTPLELLAYNHYNRALSIFCKKDSRAKSLKCEERELLKAERYAPNNFRVNHGLYYLFQHKKKEPQRAQIHFDRGVAALSQLL